jgi:hypothetical protein
MSNKHGALKELEGIIARFAGDDCRKRIMEGSKAMTEEMDDSVEVAKLVKKAMDKFDVLLDEGTRILIMENCGYNCADVNRGAITDAVTRRKQVKHVDEFLEAEQCNPMKGTKLIRDGNTLYQIYWPQELGVRCYCSLVRKLPAEATLSPTYCHCAKGFMKKLWEAVLERLVEVRLLQTVISGADECRFAIHL